MVAKYKEDVSWTGSIVSHKVTVYDKGCGMLPNVGREAQTYLHHIVNNYDCLADVTVFLQGNPFGHITLTEEEVLAQIDSYPYERTEPFFNTRAIHEYTNLCKATYKHIFGVEYDDEIYFNDGAQWIVKKQDIVTHPKEFWEVLYQQVSLPQHSNTDGVVNPWTLEGVWQFLFGYKRETKNI